MVKAEILNKNNESVWNDFFNIHVKREYAFSLQWRRLLKSVFGYEDLYYLIKKNGQVIGILPLFIVKSKFLKDRIISLPFADMGGFYFAGHLEDSLKQEAFYSVKKNLRIMPFEIRGPVYEDNSFLLRIGAFREITPYVKFIINLDSSWGNIEQKFSRNIRRNLAKSEGKIETRMCEDVKSLPEIYRIYVREMKRLGSPPLSYSYFETLRQEFGRDFIIFTVYRQEKIIGAITLISCKDTIYADLIMSNSSANIFSPKYHLYLASLKYAWSSKKYLYYDFNRTRINSGVFEHKLRWGGEKQEIKYFCDNEQDCFLDAGQKKFSFLSRILKLCPCSFLAGIGQELRKQAGK